MNVSNRLAFYSKSRDVDPGRGTQERVDDLRRYYELAKFPNWRRTLSNFHVAPFLFDGMTYNSIEHVFQAKKIELADPIKAHAFTIESSSEIGLGDGSVAQRNRKLVQLDKVLLATWNQMSQDVMARAAVCKFAQCPAARDVLLATRDAELWHIVSRKSPVRFVHLEHIRDNHTSLI